MEFTNSNWVIYLMCILARVGLGKALELHVRSSQPVGSVIFNASLGSVWRYNINRLRSSHSGQNLVSLDSRTGHLLVSKELDCSSIVHNPFTIYIDAWTEKSQKPSRFTQFPLNVHILGSRCVLHHGKKKTLETLRSHEQGIEIVSNSSKLGSCLDEGRTVTILQEYNPESVRSCQCSYALDKPSKFEISPSTGEVRVAKAVCFDGLRVSVQGSVSCSCQHSQQHWAIHLVLRTKPASSMNSLTSILGIVDQDNHRRHRGRSRRMKRDASFLPPEFTQNLYVKSVPEEQGAGLVVGTFTIKDADTRSVTYSLLASRDGRSQDMFAIDPSSGQVTTALRLDRERIAVHYFMIFATDNQNTRVNGQASLRIDVDDVNDNKPEFESLSYSKTVTESILVGATILTVRASDKDIGINGNIEYSILNPSGVNDVFRIDPRSGSITTRASLDRETTNYYNLHIQASDKGNVPNRETATSVVEIHISDENDNYPQFSKSSYIVDVSEDLDPTGYPVVAEIKAIDADQNDNAIIRYSITGGNSLDTFEIDPVSGKLSILKSLDYENLKSFRLNIRAQDNGSPPKSNSTTVLVRVNDINDNDPKFLTTLFQEAVLENVEVGSTVMRIQAYDNDAGQNSALLYKITDAVENLPFTIDRHNGIITTNQRLDREVHHMFSFKVEVVDQGEPPRSAVTTVQVNIRDINDNAPIFNPKSYSEIISEEATPGTPVVTVTAVDVDENENARVAYTISSGDARGSFRMISQMGQGLITVAKSLNYKQQSRYILTITATDTGGLIDSATVFINVSDANTYRPVFAGTPYQIQVDENTPSGASIFKVLATDGDVGENARITYMMDDNNIFQINPVTGDISVKDRLDREETAGYAISVTATDNGNPPKSDTTDIEIIIKDINDNDPKFLEGMYNGRTSEDAVTGTSILTVSATDEDQGLNGRIRYTFEGGDNGGGDFMLDPTLGILRTAKELDRERVDHYELRAFAVDRGVPERSTSVIINIQVEDVNDNSPQFESSQIRLQIMENSPIGSTVDTISATDPDIGVNSEVDYSIVGGADADAFALTTRPGEPAVIMTLVELDYESGKQDYSIIIRARSYHLFSDAYLLIQVIDVNDNIPQLRDFLIIFNNFRNHFPTGPVGKVPAVDPDVNDELRFRFISGNAANILHLDENTGQIRLDSRLNSDVPTNGTLQVSVSDGINEVKATCRLFVRLVTEDMLFNSITLRLNDISQEAFLSPLYDRFISAIASIIPTTEDNVFIINVQDDTDVPEMILNVSFSVRHSIENSQDVFHPQQFLRERVYLQRTLLAKLSTLEVLPFDDNLCVREPCLNFEECVSILKFGNASTFIASDTMLFRPIHPINAFDCRCPEGFTGMDAEYLCDTEVNLCYSSPCGNNGSCIRHEAGYTCDCRAGHTGDQCEIDMIETKYETCDQDVCKSTSRCAPLIRGGFRCEKCPEDNNVEEEFCVDCADLDYHTKFCELTTRSFPRGSFLMFPSLKRRHRFNIALEFSTQQKNGLLFYNGRYNEMHDFIALEIINGQLQFSFSLGTDITRVQTHVTDGVNDGNWHLVHIEYLNRTATVSVGQWCDTGVSVDYGKQIGNYTCAGVATQVLEQRCSDITETCHRFLDLTGPFQIGGVPSLPTEFQVHHTDFTGCIRNVYLDEKFLDLNDFVYNNGTREGCPEKKSFCLSSPCKHGGTCYEAWNTYQCSCPSQWGGKDCSQAIEAPRRLKGSSYMLFSQSFQTVQLPWHTGISFRTRQKNAILMSVVLEGDEHVKIELVNGFIHFIYPERSVSLDDVRVDDGKWHFLETRWLTGKLLLILDFGSVQKIDSIDQWIHEKTISRVYIGGILRTVGSTPLVFNGLKGCVKDIRVGNSPNAILNNPQEHNVEPGCSVADPCDTDPCPGNSYCNNEWESYSCTCQPGYVGSKCESICDKWDPCKNGGICKPSYSVSEGYICDCPLGYSGLYCENSVEQPCPATWWGKPICGPCDCPTEKGFDAICNKTTGHCNCEENHYRPKGSDTCYPCDCYSIGSFDMSCDVVTGQCPCRNGVIGRRCDSCSSRFAEVTLRGCEVVYDSCPRSFAAGIWWDRVMFPAKPDEGQVEVATQDIQECPSGTLGEAVRRCTGNGWLEPDLTACVSVKFVNLKDQITQIESSSLKVNTFVAKDLMKKLSIATMETDNMFASDINMTYRIIKELLKFEVTQSGLNLTHTQDRNFIQNLVNSLGSVLDPKYEGEWGKVHEVLGGAMELVTIVEEYINTLSQNMLQLFTNPFDAVHDNVVIGLDYVVKDNVSMFPIPKYNNKVQNAAMFDKDTKIMLPSAALAEPSMADMVVELVEGKKPMAVVGYAMYNTLGNILPKNYSADVTRSNVPLAVNTPLFTLNIFDGNRTMSGALKAPITLAFKQLQPQNHSSPQCVYWKPDKNMMNGQWSTDGCFLRDRYEDKGKSYVTCECHHLSSFAVLMDESSVERAAVAALTLEVVTYTGLSLALLCLTVAMFLFCCLRGLYSNSNSIHINLILSIIITNLVFIVGINKTDSELACTVVAIVLHYFFMCSFAWMFTETLHLYRMLTEIRDINHGSMQFYYVIGYVIPGIIVGLAVGLSKDGYGNDKFCWLQTSDLIIWSFAGPIVMVIALNVVVFVMSAHATCRAKAAADPDFSMLKNSLKAAVVLLPLLGMAWIFGLLTVNRGEKAFHYLFAVSTFLQAVFIFLAHVVFNRRVRQECRYFVYRLQGKKGYDDTLGNTQTSMLSRSVLAYNHNDSSLDGGLNRMNIGISTTSTTSRSTSKSSGAIYRPEGYMNSHSTSTSGQIPSVGIPANAGIPPYGYDSSMFHNKAVDDPDTGELHRHHHHRHKHRSRDRDSDSDSELSAMEQGDLDLASSHSSDDDEDEQYTWENKFPKNKHLERLRAQKTPTKVPPGGPMHSTPAPPPPYTSVQGSPNQWPGEGVSTTTVSDTEIKIPPPNSLKVSDVRTSHDKNLSKHEGSLKGSRDLLTPPERSDSLPPMSDASDSGMRPRSPRDKISVQVLRPNGMTESESSSTDSEEGERWA